MKRQLLLTLSCLLLLAGWMSAFLLKSIPQGSDLYFFVPTLLLAIGMGLALKLLGGRRTALLLAVTAAASVMAVNTLFPGERISLDGFRQRFLQTPAAEAAPLTIAGPSENSSEFPVGHKLYSSDPIRVNLFARLPGGVRMMVTDEQGRIFVSLPDLGAIYLLTDRNGDGFAEQPILFQSGLDRPHGLAWHRGSLYVGETTRLLELRDSDGDQVADQQRLILDNLPDDGGHWTRSLAMGADGLLYLSIGSSCNVCQETDPRRASVLRVDPETGRWEPFASGLRNSVGLTFAADGQELWGSDNGRDMLGDDLPPDEINHLKPGGDYGWPRCYGQQQPDPNLGSVEECRQTRPAAVDLQAHSAPLGIAFGNGLKAPEDFRNSLYVAYHGSWNRSIPTGYKLVRVPFAGGKPSGSPIDVLTGWLSNGTAWGRPVAPLVGQDGALYLSDDRANVVYRITWVPQGGKS